MQLCWLLVLLPGLFHLPGVVPSTTTFRMCGVNLADFLALVCHDLGYNDPYSNARHKRNVGIVDECCKRSCSLTVWRSYCATPESSSSSTTEDGSNVIAETEEERLRTQGRDLLQRLQAQKFSRKKIKGQTFRKKKRIFEVGTIRPYFENNQVISPIEHRSFFRKHT